LKEITKIKSEKKRKEGNRKSKRVLMWGKKCEKSGRANTMGE